MSDEKQAPPRAESISTETNQQTVTETASVEDILNVRVGKGRQGPPRNRRRSAYATRDLTKGSVPRNLWFLAWPQIAEGVVNALDQMADIFWAGWVAGFRAIGGLGVAQAYAHLVMMGRMGLDLGMQAMISRAVGGRRADMANHIAIQGFTLTLILSIVTVTAGVFLAEDLLRVVGVSEDIVLQTLLYLQYQFVASGFQSFRQSTGSALQASGDTLTPMKATMLARITHLILAPFLIFGWLGLPDMGIAGAAVANLAAQSLGMCWNIYALFAGTSRLQLTFRGYYPDFRLMWRLIKIGVPASGTQLERGLSELMLVRLVTPYGDAALAAYALTRRLERLTHMGSMGLGRASGILVGQNLGADQPERAKSTVRWAITYVTLMRGVGGVLLIAFPALFISAFSREPEFVAAAIMWLRIQAVGGFFMGAGQIYQQSFNVAGDTVAPFFVTFMSMWVMEIPTAFALSRYTPLAEIGIPVAIALAMLVRLALYAGYYKTGRWMRAQVLDPDVAPRDAQPTRP